MIKKELSFKEGYEVLKKNAELLESQEEPDIDNLMRCDRSGNALLPASLSAIL